ncbi:alpha/beta-hydrolase [Calocera cornea HHB12733]|uniref:Alpha/beta-hydrolase n=1 Tax=Calocera cornea HHB12733 TaxID=1353952 RepID=A0A165EAZ8_9BASI|nr:alpha/beta-hydrolase [Calocera cornea HHB12733]
MPPLSYAPPPGPAPVPDLTAARPLPPVHPLPLPSHLPSLPTPQRPSSFPGYTLTTHLTPCARPRASLTATRRAIRPAYPPSVEQQSSTPAAKANRAKEVKQLTAQLWEQRDEVYSSPSWASTAQEEQEAPQLWAVVNRFLREEQASRGVTLFLLHSNGMTKETWEPVVGSVLRLYPVDEVLVWETYNHGDAALINAPHLGDTYDWADNARDVLQFLTYHRPLTNARAPLHLPPHDKEAEPRKVIGLGHSYGGVVMLRAALDSPELFSCLIPVEPLARPASSYGRLLHPSGGWNGLRQSTLSRRSVWPSLEEARSFFLRSPFFKAWHPAVLHAHLSSALFPHPSSPGAVALKQSPYDEVLCYFDPPEPGETWALLPALDGRVEIRWVMGKDPETFTGGEAIARELVWRRRGRTSNVVFQEAGHFIPQEAPERLAQEVVDVLMRRHGPPAQKISQAPVQARL